MVAGGAETSIDLGDIATIAVLEVLARPVLRTPSSDLMVFSEYFVGR